MAPIFRSSHQAELLAALLLHPDRDYGVTELAHQLHVPLTTLHREIDRLEEAGLIESRAVGRSRLLSANTGNRLVPALTDLLLTAYGPAAVVGEEFSELEATRLAIFGSWAARYRGSRAPRPTTSMCYSLGRSTDLPPTMRPVAHNSGWAIRSTRR